MADLTGLGSLFDFGGKLIDKIYPDATKAAEAKAALLNAAQAGELQLLQAEFADRASARTLAAADIAGGNNVTRFASAVVRPLWGIGAFVIVASSVAGSYSISPAIQSIIETVLYFYFGGRVIEKIAPTIAAAYAGGGK